MSQQANITVFDGAATPVSHTLVPVDNKVLKDGTRLVQWRENIASLPIQAQVSLELRQRVFPTGVVETRAAVLVPVMESIAGANAQGYTASPKVAYVDKVEYVQYNHPRSTVNSRRLAAQILRNLISNVSTSVPAVAAGVVDESAIQQFLPT